MENPTVVLTLEELGFMLTALGAEDMASGLLKSYYGDLSEDRWELLFQAATHSLMSKGFIADLNEEEQQIEFDPEIVGMLAHMAQSRSMLRGHRDNQTKEHTLTLHEQEGKYLYHVSSNNELHFFRWSSPDEWYGQINEVFGLRPLAFRSDSRGVSLNEAQWEQLTSPGFTMKLTSDWNVGEQGEQVLLNWHKDFHNNGNSLDNLSRMIYDDSDTDGPTVTGLLFLLQGSNDIWVVRNTESDMQAPPALRIESVTEREWRALIADFTEPFRQKTELHG
ncbi:hypothetical protein [Paenibacillus massiliensis]|uniref:hypothetical protein n=1 Tax=Paenibacillus massiliensis TaxID=225917 RepID=UPI000415A383|nr:hypothetical protein [Paenibacillus massiliensis]